MTAIPVRSSTVSRDAGRGGGGGRLPGRCGMEVSWGLVGLLLVVSSTHRNPFSLPHLDEARVLFSEGLEPHAELSVYALIGSRGCGR